jgi:hypothetical protein
MPLTREEDNALLHVGFEQPQDAEMAWRAIFEMSEAQRDTLAVLLLAKHRDEMKQAFQHEQLAYESIINILVTLLKTFEELRSQLGKGVL